MENIGVAELVGDTETFFRDYLGKAPFIRPGALRSPEALMSRRDVDGLLNMEGIRPPYITVSLHGKPVSEGLFTRDLLVQGNRVTDSVVPERVAALFREGATVTWPTLNHLMPKMHELSLRFSEVLTARTDVVAFLTPPGQRGFRVHRDKVDIFVIQVLGAKHWQVWETPADWQTRARPVTEDVGDPALAPTLEPGDLMYLPHGTPHVATAGDDTSLHLSVTVRRRGWRDILSACLDRALRDPAFDGHPDVDAKRESVEEALREQLARLGSVVAGTDPGEQLDRVMTTRGMPGCSRVSAFEEP